MRCTRSLSCFAAAVIRLTHFVFRESHAALAVVTDKDAFQRLTCRVADADSHPGLQRELLARRREGSSSAAGTSGSSSVEFTGCAIARSAVGNNSHTPGSQATPVQNRTLLRELRTRGGGIEAGREGPNLLRECRPC